MLTPLPPNSDRGKRLLHRGGGAAGLALVLRLAHHLQTAVLPKTAGSSLVLDRTPAYSTLPRSPAAHLNIMVC